MYPETPTGAFNHQLHGISPKHKRKRSDDQDYTASKRLSSYLPPWPGYEQARQENLLGNKKEIGAPEVREEAAKPRTSNLVFRTLKQIEKGFAILLGASYFNEEEYELLSAMVHKEEFPLKKEPLTRLVNSSKGQESSPLATAYTHPTSPAITTPDKCSPSPPITSTPEFNIRPSPVIDAETDPDTVFKIEQQSRNHDPTIPRPAFLASDIADLVAEASNAAGPTAILNKPTLRRSTFATPAQSSSLKMETKGAEIHQRQSNSTGSSRLDPESMYPKSQRSSPHSESARYQPSKTRTCRFWAAKKCRFNDEQCRDLHSFDVGFGGHQNREKAKSCWYWITPGYHCSKSSEECKYAHEHTGQVAIPPGYRLR